METVRNARYWIDQQILGISRSFDSQQSQTRLRSNNFESSKFFIRECDFLATVKSYRPENDAIFVEGNNARNFKIWLRLRIIKEVRKRWEIRQWLIVCRYPSA